MFHCRTHVQDYDQRETRRGEERRRDETGWQQEGEENFIPIDKDLLTHYLYVPLQDTHMGWRREGEEKRGDRMATRRRGEFVPLDKDIFNPLSLHCRTHAWDGDERVKRRGDGLDDENGGSTLIHCVIQCLCVHLH